MDVVVKKITDIDLMLNACESTFVGKSNMTLDKIYKCQHSPIRTQIFWVELKDIPTFVSVHLVRHKIGVEHFVLSRREDRGGGPNSQSNRLTPINHSMLINAESLINMSRKRLCGKASKETQEVMNLIKEGVSKCDEVLAKYMMPECHYRNMYCPELKPCGKYKVSTNLFKNDAEI